MLDGGWSITQDLFDFICKNYPADKYPNLLEFGSGVSTNMWFKAGYNIVSLEHDKNYLAPQSIHAPLENGYYKEDLVKKFLADRQWDIIIIDGPPGRFRTRYKILNYIRGHEPRVLVIDDTHRGDGVAISIAFTAKEFHTIEHSKKPIHAARVLVEPVLR